MPTSSSLAEHHRELFMTELAAQLPVTTVLEHLTWHEYSDPEIRYQASLALGPTSPRHMYSHAHVTIRRESVRLGFIGAVLDSATQYATDRHSFDDVVALAAKQFSKFVRVQAMGYRLRAWLLPLGVRCRLSQLKPPSPARSFWNDTTSSVLPAQRTAMRKPWNKWSLGVRASPALYGLASNWVATQITPQTPYPAVKPFVDRLALVVGLAPLAGDEAWMAMVTGTSPEACSAWSFSTSSLGAHIVDEKPKPIQFRSLMRNCSLIEALDCAAEAEGEQLRQWFPDYYQQHYQRQEQQRLQHMHQVTQAQAWLRGDH